MTVLRMVARPLLASVFVYGGIAALRNTEALAARAQPLSDAATSAKDTLAPQLRIPTGPKTVVRATAAVHIAAGVGLATGTYPRTSATILAATMGPVTATSHQFWSETDPDARTNQRAHFTKNLAVTGGLLMSTLDPDPDKKSWFTQARQWNQKRKLKREAKAEVKAKVEHSS